MRLRVRLCPLRCPSVRQNPSLTITQEGPTRARGSIRSPPHLRSLRDSSAPVLPEETVNLLVVLRYRRRSFIQIVPSPTYQPSKHHARSIGRSSKAYQPRRARVPLSCLTWWTLGIQTHNVVFRHAMPCQQHSTSLNTNRHQQVNASHSSSLSVHLEIATACPSARPWYLPLRFDTQRTRANRPVP